MVLKDDLFHFIKRYFSISSSKGLRERKILRREIGQTEHGCRFLNSLLHVISIKEDRKFRIRGLINMILSLNREIG